MLACPYHILYELGLFLVPSFGSQKPERLPMTLHALLVIAVVFHLVPGGADREPTLAIRIMKQSVSCNPNTGRILTLNILATNLGENLI